MQEQYKNMYICLTKCNINNYATTSYYNLEERFSALV